MKSSEAHNLDDLIRAHGPFLQRLARALTSDAATADDLVSDTWMAALRPGLGPLRNERGWLATVLRRRAAAVQSRPPVAGIEDAERHPSVDSSPDEILAQLEREQLVNGALSRLEDPYRSVIFLRYHDGLTPTVIAERTNTPHKTVRTQISRGLDKLRRSLDQEMRRHGASDPRAEWLGALVPLALAPAAPSSAPLAASLAMKKFAALVVAAFLVAAGGILAAWQFGIQSGGSVSMTEGEVGTLGDAEDSRVARAEESQRNASASPRTALPSPRAAEPGSDSRQAILTTIAEPPQAAEATLEQAILGFAGSVVLVEGPSVRPSSLDGQIEVWFWTGSSGRSITVPVTDGSFRAEFEPEGEELMRLIDGDADLFNRLKGVTLSFGAPDFPVLGSTVVVSKNGELGARNADRISFGTEDAVIHIKRLPPSRLEVVDQSTGAEVTGIRVLGNGFFEAEGAIHPAGIKPISMTEDTRSPVILTPPTRFVERRVVAVLVGAPGYAWTPLTLDLWEGIERRVELQLGGELSVAVTV